MPLDSLGHLIGEVVVAGQREILLAGVAEHVDEPVGGLFDRQGEQIGRVEHRELRRQRERGVPQLAVAGPVGEHGRVTHLGAGGRRGQHHAERHEVLRGGLAGFDIVVPQVLVLAQAGAERDELGAVDDRTTADGQDQGHAMLLDQLHAFEDLVEPRVRRHAGQFDDLVAGFAQRGRHVVIGAVALDRAAAVDQQHGSGARLGLLGHMHGLAFTEVDLDGIVEDEVSHAFISFTNGYVMRWVRRTAEPADRSTRTAIHGSERCATHTALPSVCATARQ